MKQVNQNKAIVKSFHDLIRLPLSFVNGGFTLIEILVVVLIIGILGAIMLPQYQRAVLKSRFAALMPIAKSMADSNEAFYLEHGEYADNAEDLPIQGRRNYSDGTELEFGTTTDYSYVLATNPGVENNAYIVYQKHSENFPGNIHCEALTEDNLANQVCLSFGGTPLEGSLGGEDYTAYLLVGNPTSGQFPKPCTTEPDTQQACSGCGFMTREATCNTKTGEWEYDGEFDPDTCPTQPEPETGESCGTGYTGNLTRAATCSDDHSAWEYVGEWSRSACEEIPTCTGDQPANTKAACEKGYSGTMMGSYSCKSGEWVVTWDTSTCAVANGNTTYNANNSGPTWTCTSSATETCSGNNTFHSASCNANTEGTCIGNTYESSPGNCRANAEYTCSEGTYTYKSPYSTPPQCTGTSANSCTKNMFLMGTCEGNGNNSCSGNTFSGQTQGTTCQGRGVNTCSNGNTFDTRDMSNNAYCYGRNTEACSNNTFLGNRSVCWAEEPGSCQNNTYKDGAKCQGAYCPVGSVTGWSSGKPRCKNENGNSGTQYCN